MCREVRELTCIGCPCGCLLKVEIDRAVLNVSGNGCQKGEKYGKSEATNPVRTLTTTIKVVGRRQRVIPVRTNGEIPKDKVFQCMKIIKQTEIKAPKRLGEVIITDIAETGIDVVTTKALI